MNQMTNNIHRFSRHSGNGPEFVFKIALDAKTIVLSIQHAIVMSMQWLEFTTLSMQALVKGCKTGFT